MRDQADDRQRRWHLNRDVFVTLLVAMILLLGCVGVGVVIGEGRQLHVGGYRVSYWRPPGNTSVLLTMSKCEGSLRYVSTYGLRHPRTWAHYQGATFLYYAYSSTDPNCLYL
jgi:hypothetical protein